MGLFKKPKAPKPTASQVELERRQRTDLDELTREENRRLKSIKRGRQSRRTLLGSAGIRNDDQGGRAGGGGGGLGGRPGRPGAGGGGGGGANVLGGGGRRGPVGGGRR